jgi:hypothetical protein
VHEHYWSTGSGACYPDRRHGPIPGNCRAEDSSLCAAPLSSPVYSGTSRPAAAAYPVWRIRSG